jgi:glycosyltransferase involved in cell wall biosynthesis
MRILIPVLNFGKSGGYRVLSKIADELIHLGHSVDFISPETSNLPYYPTKAVVLWVNRQGKIVPKSTRKLDVNESGFSILFKLTLGLKKLKTNSYDVVIANHSLTTFAVKIAGLGKKCIYYSQAYEPELHLLLGGLKNRMLSYLYSFSYKMDLFTIVNSEIYLDYKNLKSSRILYPGIDFQLFYPNEIRNTKKQGEKIILGTIGRAENFKGTNYVLSAFRELQKLYPQIQLHVAFGNPEDFRSYKGIYCVQPHGDKALGTFYRSLDYYICAGYTQLGAFHYPVAEAMSCGIPVITTHYYPASETNALLIKPKSVSDIVSAFQLAEKDPTLKEARVNQALNNVKKFDWKIVGKTLDNYLTEFLASSKA